VIFNSLFAAHHTIVKPAQKNLIFMKNTNPRFLSGVISDYYRVFLERNKITKTVHSVIFFMIRPSRKTVMPPPLWETTMPTHLVTLVMAATEL